MTEVVKIRVDAAPVSSKPELADLLMEYLDEMASMAAAGGESLERNDDGTIRYHWFDHYWSEPERIPFAIWIDNDLAGFCLLRDTGDEWQIAEFFIKSHHRRHGVGTEAVSAVKAFCLASGRHQNLIATTRVWNPGALEFWRRQGFETVAADDVRLKNVFTLHPTNSGASRAK